MTFGKHYIYYLNLPYDLPEALHHVEWYISRLAQNSLNSQDCRQFNFVFIPS